MANEIEIRVPDIGDFSDVEVIEVLVKVGDLVRREDPLITLESDKATIDVPSPGEGRVHIIHAAKGDRVSEGSPIVSLTPVAPARSDSSEAPAQSDRSEAPAPATDKIIAEHGNSDRLHAQVLVLGAGPGGYTAAFRAADLGRTTILVERYPSLGGVCLNVGCIPSKALLHAAAVISEAREMGERGVRFGEPQLDLVALAKWKDTVVNRLTSGLAGLARQRKVRVIEGTGRFAGPHELEVQGADGVTRVHFDHAIIAAGSEATGLPGAAEDERIMSSTGALQLTDVPGRLLIIGGGIIGLEMATVYSELGSQVTVVELGPQLLPGVDKDLVRPLEKRLRTKLEAIRLNTAVEKLQVDGDQVRARFSSEPNKDIFDRVLVAIGRRPNGDRINAEAAGVQVDERGFIQVDAQQRTNIPHIFAIGDLTGQPMLAHKATHEGKVAAEVAAGEKSGFEARVIPSVAYTDPEVAWVGVTEAQANADGLDYGKGTFPWAASGRALGLGREDGLTKLLFDKSTGRVIGAGIVGPRAGDLIAEAALAIETGCDASDISLTVHPHPTLSETVAFAAESFEGTITDLYMPRR
ncbi:MAG: dihydrolipoyl dehydrogenase [Gammaproteobacteria bacterium]|nr:dihydrolipoyl dehydrogenase [Gammaproteobacteria bacterium]